MQARKIVHHHSSDPRFCGSPEPFRQFSFDESEVTCQLCRDAAALETTKLDALDFLPLPKPLAPSNDKLGAPT